MANDKSKSAQMSALISSWRNSGVSKKAFCASSNINIHTFTYWLAKERGASHGSGFLELGVVCDSDPLELHFPQGAFLRLGGCMSSEQLLIVKSLLY